MAEAEFPIFILALIFIARGPRSAEEDEDQDRAPPHRAGLNPRIARLTADDIE